MLLHVLGPGRILVAGADEVENGGGWCAVVEESDSGGAADFSVKVFFRESQLKKWVEPVRGVRPSGLMFRPLLITEPPVAGGDRSVWVICTPVPRSICPILRINPTTLAWDEYNLFPHEFEINRRGHQVDGFDTLGDVIWTGPTHALNSHNQGAGQLTAGAQFCDGSETRSICSLLEVRGRGQPMLRYGSQIYMPRNTWYRIDPVTLEARRIGPGVRAEGQLIGGELEYFVSARLGLAAFSPTDSCFYRISLDSAHPLRVRATADPLPPLAPPPGDGVVEIGTQETTFRSGLGDLVFRGGHLETPGDFHGGAHLGVLIKEREKGFTDFTINVISRRLNDPAERERAGMTDEDMARYHAVLPRCNNLMTAKIDVERLEKMYRDFEPSVGGPREHEAAKPLLDEARKLGDRWAADANEYLTLTRGAFTTRQWRLLQYEDPDGKE